MKTISIFLASLALSQAAWALDGQQFARAHEAWTEMEQTSARAYYANLYLKDGNMAQVCFVLGAMVSEIDAAEINLNILLYPEVSKGISEKILADIRNAKTSVEAIKAEAVSTIGACGAGGYRWKTNTKLSNEQLSGVLKQINSEARVLADSFTSTVYSK